MFHRHRSFFPLVLVLLTVLLIALMVWKLQPADAPAPAPAPASVSEETPADEPVTMAEYEQALGSLLREFFARYDAADQDFLRVIATDETLTRLLDLKVPTQYKDLHLKVAVNLNLIRRGLAGDPELLETGLNNFQDLRQVYPWLP